MSQPHNEPDLDNGPGIEKPTRRALCPASKSSPDTMSIALFCSQRFGLWITLSTRQRQEPIPGT